ncbi:type II CRISPR RNA-guided endonuclease Cas9 [Chryseobacterium sp. sg2396]|uniref:type II CRISPR RNA-guided endonuclease Cas9 n=1 Tax=Chryseobacterium sp. sg2396 TaxID=3276280 RepID=UPI00366EF3A8
MEIKKILGLDIGTTSIGYSIIEISDEKNKNFISDKLAVTDINNDRIGIFKDAVGVRIINQDTDRFDRGLKLNDPKGSTLTPTANRRKFRGVRRIRNRYKLRRNKLYKVLSVLGITPDESYFTNKKGKRGKENDIGKALYGLRERATKEKITLPELARVLLHLNQLRGYSSDRFAKDEEIKFDYYLTEVVELDWENRTPVFEKGSTEEVKYYQFKVKLRFVEPYIIIEDDEKNVFEEIEGYVFKKEIDFVLGDFITIKAPEFKQNKKGKVIVEEYYKITPTKPDATDWKYKYQTLHKNLSDWCKTRGTVGSYFYRNFYELSNLSRIRNNVVNREWYEKEFDAIWALQYEFHKEFFDKIDISNLVKEVFKDYSTVLNGVITKDGNKEQLKTLIKDKIIFYQRPWQQTKSKGRCEFEKIKVKREFAIKGTGTKELREEHIGRTVVPRSHPIFQNFKVWQQINNVRLIWNTADEKINLFENAELCEKRTGKTIEEVKRLLFKKLQGSKTLSWRTFVKDELGLDTYDEIEEKRKAKVSKKQGLDLETGEVVEEFFSVNFRKRKRDGSYDDIKLKGNTTKAELRNILKDKSAEWFEELHHQNKKVTNLQLLWEIIYDITNSDVVKVASIIKRHFAFDDEICLTLAKVQFDDAGMANISAKAIRNLLPLMSDGINYSKITKTKVDELISLNSSETDVDEGEKLSGLKDFVTDRKARIRLSKFSNENDFKYLNYWEAAAIVYGSHSSKRSSVMKIMERLKNHSMNNPVVEKIVNETISIVNLLKKEYGFDEVRIELSRELRASADERQQMWEGMNNNTAKNEWAKKMLREIKQAMLEDDRDVSQLDTEISGSNLDKIKIIEDVVKYQKPVEFKTKEKEYKLTEPTKAEVTKYLLWLEQNFKCPYTNQPIPLTDVFARGKVVEIEHIIPRQRYYSNAYANKVITWREVNQEKGNKTAYEFIVSKRNPAGTVKVGKKEISLVSASQWENHVKEMFPKSGKRNNLLRKEIPEDPIERTLKETQYINKKLKEKLGELVGPDKVWVTSGAITDILRENWKLNDVWKELVEERFVKFNNGETKDRLNLKYITRHFNNKTNQYEDVEKFAGMSKRIDHRHHALDAIIIACTKQNHIQYINNLNAINSADIENDDSKKAKYKHIKTDVCLGNSSSKFKFPWDERKFIPEVKEALKNVLISHKNSNVLISPSKHRNNKDINSGKVASVRGELHLQTNYTKKKYFENEKIDIVRIIPLLFKKKFENQNQTLVRFKSFNEIIKETILKEKYQNVLISLFEEYDAEKFNLQTVKDFSKKVLKRIEDEKLFIHEKSGEKMTWLSTFTKKNASVRPMGLSMDLNNEKEIKDFANPRLRRIGLFRLNYVNKKIAEIKALKLPFKEDENNRIREVKEIPLYNNAIYEVRIRQKDGKHNWIEIKDLQQSDLENIEYAKSEMTIAIKNKLSEFSLDELKETYVSNPIFLSDRPTPVKKARQKSFFQDLYELKDGRYVYSRDVFMTYVLVPEDTNRKDAKRELEFLKFFDAVKIVTLEKPDKIDYRTLVKKEGCKLLFTLSKNDIAYIPDELLTDEQILEINWNDKKEIIPKLFVVKEMTPSRNEIVFQHLYKSDSIRVNGDEAENILNTEKLEEQIKYGDTNMWKRCIKVEIDKLGKGIKPYWEK